MLSGKHIILGITGSIAAYKSVLLVREFIKHGAEVQVVMTPSAKEFITTLTLSTISGKEVIVDMFPSDQSKGTWHIHSGMWADAMLIAPASANTIAKLAHGFADNALTSLVLALRCPLIVAPVMDTDMYFHQATQENISILRNRGVKIIEPESGELASGLEGIGRLPEPNAIVQYIDNLLNTKNDFAGKSVLITAGPTHEAIDPVRYLTNHSSGKMGFAIAQAMSERGADVILISGPVQLETPIGVKRINVTSASEMFDAVTKHQKQADVIIMSAAVADFTPVHHPNNKMKKEKISSDHFSLQLELTKDILQHLGSTKTSKQILVGFALETENEIQNALEKLKRKNADIIVLNNPLQKGAGFGVDTNVVTILTRDGNQETTGKLKKIEIAHLLLDRIMQYTAALNP